MNTRTIFRENLNREIREFRESFQNVQPTGVYNSFYKINFYEEYYLLLISVFIGEYTQLVEWLSKFENPLAFLYSKWLNCDGAFSGDWNDMVDFITNLYEEEK